MSIQLTQRNDGIILVVKVVPGPSRDRIAGDYGGAVKINVSKAAQDGAANQAVIALLAAVLGVSPEQIEITRGRSSPRKVVLLRGISAEAIRRRLEAT